MTQYPAITIPSLLPLPPIPTDPSQYYEYFRALHGVLVGMQAHTANAIDVLNFFRITMPPSGESLADIPDASNSGALYIDSKTGRVFYDNKTADPPVWQEVIPGGIKVHSSEPADDSLRINEGTFWYSTPGSGIIISDTHVLLTSTYTKWLDGITGNVADALEAIDALGAGVYMDNAGGISWKQTQGGGPYGWLTGIVVNSSDEVDIGSIKTLGINLNNDVDAGANDFTTTGTITSTDAVKSREIMGGLKVSVSDNTSTTIVTFTMKTGPSHLAVGLTFVGDSTDSTDQAKVIIQGWLIAVRNSSGVVTAEWEETYLKEKATGSVTFGSSNAASVNVSGADVQMKVLLDSSLNQSWNVRWTALMSNTAAVTEA